MDLDQKKTLLMQTGGALTNSAGVFTYQPPQPPLPPAITISPSDIDAMIAEEQSAIDADNSSITDDQNQLAYFTEQSAAINAKITASQTDIGTHQANIVTLQNYKSQLSS